MRTSGGRGPGVVLAGVLAALLSSALLSGCTEDADRAHVLQTHLGRIDHVDRVDVTAPTRTQGTAIRVTFDDQVDGPDALAKLIADVDAAADEEKYPTYRLDLAPHGDDAALVVDDSFTGSDREDAILKNWFAVRDTLIGGIQVVAEPGSETITVDSAGGIAHDVSEASRMSYGTDQTTWVFVNGDTSFTASGRIGSSDVTLFQDVQRSVSSESLPASAPSWRLDRRAGHVRLDLDVDFSDESVPPAELTIGSTAPRSPRWRAPRSPRSTARGCRSGWTCATPTAPTSSRPGRQGWPRPRAGTPSTATGTAGWRPRRSQSAGSATYVVSRYSSMPSKPPSRPNPLCFTPPNGAAGLEISPVLMPTMPNSSASARRIVRLRSRV